MVNLTTRTGFGGHFYKIPTLITRNLKVVVIVSRIGFLDVSNNFRTISKPKNSG